MNTSPQIESRALPVAAHTPGRGYPMKLRVQPILTSGPFAGFIPVTNDAEQAMNTFALVMEPDHARLIAAAPDQHAQLIRNEDLLASLVNVFKRDNLDAAWISTLEAELGFTRAAIAKAKGL